MIMLLAFLPTRIIASAENVSSGTCGDNLTWTLEDGVLAISGTGKMYDYSTISNSAPWDSKSFSSVIIESAVTSIGSHAFDRCTGLTSITIPDSVTNIGNYAFSGCSGLTSVTIGNGVISIGGSAFEGCTSLMSVTIPNSVTSIGGNAFAHSGYYNDELNWDKDVLYIGKWLIKAKERISCNYDINNGTVGIGDFAFYHNANLMSVDIPGSVVRIGGHAFRDCPGLTSITIPDSVTSIGGYAFYGCTGLTSVTIPASVTSIGGSAFSGCTGLTSITVAPGNSIYHGYGNCIIETETKALIVGCKSSVIPDDGSVTSIGGSAFSGCTGLTSITIPYTVTSIGYGAFAECSGMTSVTIPNSVTSIGDRAFYDCTGLTSVVITKSVVDIGINAFHYYKDNSFVPIDAKFTIYENTYAHQYVKSNNINYELIKLDYIVITHLPNNLSFVEAKPLDVTGGVITAYYDNDTSEEIEMTADMVSGFDNRRVGIQTLTVAYEGQTATFDVEIIAKTLTDMRITSLPNKTRYIEYKGGLDLSGGKYTLYYDNDTTETLNITADMVSGFDITSIGRQTLTVTYGDFTDMFEVEVVPKSISHIAVTTLPNKTSYSEAKETFDATGGVVTVYYDNDMTEVVDLGDEMVMGFNNRISGTQTLTVVYQGHMTTFNVTIVARTLVSIAATHLPDKVTYREGEEFDSTGLEVTAYYDNDTEEIITDYGIFGYYSTPGERAVTVTYGGKYYSFGVVVLANKIKGDPDGDGAITVADALIALRVAARLAQPTPELIACCDTDGDGEITVADALAI
ncbi:MAG: leucine-rich repeat protein, partial [Clostridia bacterium]|nr:leucine-rich repeat protein [Clostridia bacterium]